MFGIVGLVYNCFNHNIYSVVNNDHVDLYRTLARLNKIVPPAGSGQKPDDSKLKDVAKIFGDFVDKLRAHNQREEGLMNRYAYPMLKDHADQHNVLLSSFENIHLHLRAGNNALTGDEIVQVKTRLTGHIGSADSILENYLAECVDQRTDRRPDLSQPSRNPLFYIRAIANGVPSGMVMANRNKRAALDSARQRRAEIRENRAAFVPADAGRRAMDAMWYR